MIGLGARTSNAMYRLIDIWLAADERGACRLLPLFKMSAFNHYETLIEFS